jgi:type I restriction enzyme S subunit
VYPVTTLASVCRRITDGTHQSPTWTASGVPFLFVSNINDGSICLKTKYFVSDETYDALTRSCPIEPGDVLYTAVGSYGRTAVVRSSERFLFQRHIAHIKPDPSLVNPDFLSHLLSSPIVREQADRVAKGVAQKTVTLSDLKSFEIVCPPLPEQRRIAAILDEADALRAKQRAALAQLDEMAQAIFIEMFIPGSAAWPLETIGSLGTAIRTGPFGSQLLHSEFVDEGIAVLGIDNAVRNEFAWDARRYITPAKYRTLSRFRVFPDDVIITIMGTCGRVAIVPTDIELAITTKHLCSITLDKSRCLPVFLHACLLMHPDVLDQMGVSAKGAIMPGLNMGLIKSIKLPLPPLTLQIEFAKRKASLSAVKVQMAQSLNHLDALFASLQHRAFAGEL